MAQDNETEELSTPSSSRRTTALRAKPYDANNSFIKKVATKMTDIIPQRSWISKWFNGSQDESGLQETETDNAQFDDYKDKESQPPPIKRPCIRIDVTHPPGTFTIQPINRNAVTNDVEASKDRFSNHNETTQDFLEPLATGRRLDRFVASTPAFHIDTAKTVEARSSLNVIMTEQNNNGTTNGVDDNSESSESTSGCSSLIPQNNRQEAPPNSSYNTLFGNKRKFVDDKFSFTNHLQSPRSLFLDSTHRETLASRRPSFNSSMMNNTTLNKSSSLLSPFYPGNTTFGGANAVNLYRSSNALTDPSQFHNRTIQQRASVEVNPANKSSVDLAGMSHTAKRILETLEQFSSPLSDAKKMPVRNIMGGNSNFYSSPTTSRKRSREDDTASPKCGLRHLTRELTVPTVPDMLRIRRKQRLQNSTVNARKIATARTAANAQQEYHIRTKADVEPPRSSQLKAKKKTNLEQQETVEPVNLPTIPLPITLSSLPRFDISLPQATKPATPERPKQQSVLQVQSNNDSFKFASPIRLTEANKTLESISNFTFSQPITPSKMLAFSATDSENLSKTLSVDSSDTFNATGSAFPNFMWTGPSQTIIKPKEKVKEKKEEVTGGIKVATELKEGSVMDFFKKHAEVASKPAETSVKSESLDLWECNECLIKNNGKESHCVACKSVKPSGDSSSDIEVLEISSDDDDVMLVEASESRKENEPKSKPQASSSSIFSKSSKSSNVELTPKLSLPTFVNETSITDSSAPLSKIVKDSTIFSAKKSTWECPCCMVKNTDSTTTCPCCSTAKPGSVNVSPKRTVETTVNATATSDFGNMFTKPEGSWTCDTCMIQNKCGITKCAACETPKLGTKPAPKATSGFGDMFKKPEGSWTCNSCMIQNKCDITKCAACETPKLGTKPASKATSGFGDMFKKPEGSWTCDSCMIQNKSDVAKCAACETPKPGALTSKPSSGSGFGDMFKKPESSWTCDSCMVSNKSDATKCIVCETAKLGTEKPKSNLQFKVDMPENAGSFKFGIDKADAAASALPKTNGFSFGGGASAQATSGGFSFGAPKDSTGFAFKPSESLAAAATFQFGAKPIETTTASMVTTTTTTTTGTSKEEDKSATTTIFSFGTPLKSDTPATTGFVFGASTTTMTSGSTTAEKKDAKAVTSVIAPSAGFNFSTSATSSTLTAKEFTTEEQSKQTSETSTATFMFGAPKQATDDSLKETPKSVATSCVAEMPKTTLSFGVPASTESKPATTPVFTFGATSTAAASSASTSTATSTPITSLFTFTGAQKTSEASPENTAPLPPFGSPAAPKPTFSFSKSADTPSIQQSENKPTLGLISATPSFGSQTNQVNSSLFSNVTATSSSTSLGSTENKPLLFCASEKKVAPSFSEPSAKMSAFDSVIDTKSTTSTFSSATATPAFGTSTSATNPKSTASPFGSASNMFGSQATSTFESTTAPGIFSATTKASETPAVTPGIFTFGASSQTTGTPATGGFNFSAVSNVTPTNNQRKAGIFSFGASSTTGPIAIGFGTGRTFGATATSSATPAATANFSFNAPKRNESRFDTVAPTPVFNAPNTQIAVPPPAYPGTVNPVPAAGGFNFGSSAMPTNFNFVSTPASATSGFNFNAPSTPTAPPTFDPNAQPTFNFTANSGAPTTFNAPGVCASTVPSSRKIKKAVRRMPRQ